MDPQEKFLLPIRLTHKSLTFVRNIFEDPTVEALAKQIHEALNNKKIVRDF